MKQNEPNEYAMIDLKRYERLIADEQKLDELLCLINKSTKYNNRKEDLVIVNGEDILKYLKEVEPSYYRGMLAAKKPPEYLDPKDLYETYWE